MVWAKTDGNGKVVGTAANAPPTNEAGKPELGWEERPDNDPAVQAYYDEQNKPPPSTSEALWDEFRSRIASPTYLRIVTTNAITQALNPILISRLGRAEMNAEALGDLMQTWNAIATHGKPTVLEIAELNKIAGECKMPFRLDVMGKMVAI